MQSCCVRSAWCTGRAYARQLIMFFLSLLSLGWYLIPSLWPYNLIQLLSTKNSCRYTKIEIWTMDNNLVNLSPPHHLPNSPMTSLTRHPRDFKSVYQDMNLDPCQGMYDRIMEWFDLEINQSIFHIMLLEQVIGAGTTLQAYLCCAQRSNQTQIFCLHATNLTLHWSAGWQSDTMGRDDLCLLRQLNARPHINCGCAWNSILCNIQHQGLLLWIHHRASGWGWGSWDASSH